MFATKTLWINMCLGELHILNCHIYDCVTFCAFCVKPNIATWHCPTNAHKSRIKLFRVTCNTVYIFFLFIYYIIRYSMCYIYIWCILVLILIHTIFRYYRIRVFYNQYFVMWVLASMLWIFAGFLKFVWSKFVRFPWIWQTL